MYEITDLIITNLLTKKNPGLHSLIGEFYQIFKEEMMSVLQKLFHKIEKKETERQRNKNYKPTTFMKGNVKFFKKISQPNSTIHKENPLL